MHQAKADKDKQRAYFRLIEKEIYQYHNTKRQLEDLRSAIIDERGLQEVPSGGRISDTTANKAVRLVSSTSLYQMERAVRAIEESFEELDHLGPVVKEMIRLKYWDKRLKDYGIMQQLNIPRTTFYRWRDGFVHSIASKLGWDAGQESVR